MRRHHVVRFLFLLSFWLCLGGAELQAAAAPIITNFDSAAVLGKDGTVTVTETITADMPGGGHGMFREIPFAVKLPSGQIVKMPPDVLEVTLDGEAVSSTDTELLPSSVLRIYMRDTAKTLEKGEHTFSLTYAMPYMVGYFADYDELNWNVTGNLWAVPIEKAGYRLFLPEGAVVDRVSSWLGEPGSREDSVLSSKSEDDGQPVIIFQAQRALSPGEGLTCAVSWNKGVVAQPEVPEQVVSSWALWADMAMLAVALLVWGYFAVVWWLFGKDPAKGVCVPLFYPPAAPASFGLPKGTLLSPAAVNYLMNAATLEARGLSALLLSLVCRKACVISGDAEAGFRIAATGRNAGDTPYPEEQAAQIRIAAEGPLPLGQRGADTLAGIMQEAQKLLNKGCPNLWSFNVRWTLLGIVLAVLGLLGCVCMIAGLPGQWDADVEDSLSSLALIGLGLLFMVFIVVVLVRQQSWMLALGILLVEVFVGVLMWEELAEELALAGISPIFLAGMGATLLAPCVFGGLMKAPSVEARKLMDACEGLAMYIRTAETERFRQLNPPERTPELYTRLLPYAVALNLEKAWGENCAAVLGQALADDRTLERDLYTMGTSAVVSGTASGIAAYEASRSSASDNDGGGSGSGGGGGGGGFC